MGGFELNIRMTVSATNPACEPSLTRDVKTDMSSYTHNLSLPLLSPEMTSSVSELRISYLTHTLLYLAEG